MTAGGATTSEAVSFLNGLGEQAAIEALLSCCPHPSWAAAVARGRPYADAAEFKAAGRAALAAIPDAELPALLGRYPRIGTDPGTGVAAGWSRQEESGVHASAAAVLSAIAEANAAYEERFGYTFLVSAAGLTGPEILGVLRQRLAADPARELATARAELTKIGLARMDRLLAAGSVGPGG